MKSSMALAVLTAHLRLSLGIPQCMHIAAAVRPAEQLYLQPAFPLANDQRRPLGAHQKLLRQSFSASIAPRFQAQGVPLSTTVGKASLHRTGAARRKCRGRRRHARNTNSGDDGDAHNDGGAAPAPWPLVKRSSPSPGDPPHSQSLPFSGVPNADDKNLVIAADADPSAAAAAAAAGPSFSRSSPVVRHFILSQHQLSAKAAAAGAAAAAAGSVDVPAAEARQNRRPQKGHAEQAESRHARGAPGAPRRATARVPRAPRRHRFRCRLHRCLGLVTPQRGGSSRSRQEQKEEEEEEEEEEEQRQQRRRRW